MTTPSFPAWAPYAVAVCLMLVAVDEARHILDLKAQLSSANAEVTRLSNSSAMTGLRVTPLEARDVIYSSAKVSVAWDPYQSRGVLATQNLPTPAAGYSYQLWVLDPAAITPVSAGLLNPETQSLIFTVKPTSTISPGFAITLEPGQGSVEPTGTILFAVSPAQ